MQLTKKLPNLILAALTFAAFIWCSFSANAMEQFVRLHGFANIFGSAARWICTAGFLAVLPALLTGERRCRAIAVFAVLPAEILSVVFSRAFFAVHAPAPHEIAAYALLHAAMAASCLLLIFDGERPSKSDIARAARLFPLLLLGAFPLNFFMQFETLMTAEFLQFRNFGLWHVFFVLLLAGATVGLYFLLRGKTAEEKSMALFLLSLALFSQLCLRFSFVRLQDYQAAHGIVGALPLFVCSFGVVLLPFAVLSGSAFFRGALFMINCPGAIIAFVWPAAGEVTVFHYNVTYFVYCHILLFVTTAHLAVSLNGAPRKAHLKHLSYAIAVYYFSMVILNGLAVHWGHGYDPNFSYVAQCPLPLPLHTILPVRLGIFLFSPVYLLVLCAVQFALCLITYFIYGLFSKIIRKRGGGNASRSKSPPLPETDAENAPSPPQECAATPD